MEMKNSELRILNSELKHASDLLLSFLHLFGCFDLHHCLLLNAIEFIIPLQKASP